MTHPAIKLSFDDLWAGLQAAKAEKLVYESIKDGLHLYCYTDSCVYDRKWSDITLAARGLILDPVNKKIVALPFPKFFNVGEGDLVIPDMPFETFEKLDGSLIIIFHHAGEWKTATKGSLSSDQAKWAARCLKNHDLSHLDKGITYLAEAVYPENRIVVRYTEEGLFLLGAYRNDGIELTRRQLEDVAEKIGWKIAKRHSYTCLSELLAVARALPESEEGFVLRFTNGLRLKIKGDEYTRIHSLISRLTPLAMWEAMLAGDNLEAIRKRLPEEFWQDFDSIISLLETKIETLTAKVKNKADELAGLSDKEVGLMRDQIPEDIRGFIFPYRKNKGSILTGRTREALFRSIRPDANRLDGYTPSYAMNRVIEEN